MTIRTITTTVAFALATLLGTSALAAPTAQVASDNLDTVTDTRFDAAVTLEGKININTASAAQLQLLPGIGPSIAERIVGYRETHKFEQSNNIMRVKGVGQKTFAKIQDFLTVEGQSTLRVAK